MISYFLYYDLQEAPTDWVWLEAAADWFVGTTKKSVHVSAATGMLWGEWYYKVFFCNDVDRSELSGNDNGNSEYGAGCVDGGGGGGRWQQQWQNMVTAIKKG